MIEIIIRDIDNLEGESMGRFEPHEIPDIVECMELYGCFMGQYDTVFYDARFVALPEDLAPYFEIVVKNGEDD